MALVRKQVQPVYRGIPGTTTPPTVLTDPRLRLVVLLDGETKAQALSRLLSTPTLELLSIADVQFVTTQTNTVGGTLPANDSIIVANSSIFRPVVAWNNGRATITDQSGYTVPGGYVKYIYESGILIGTGSIPGSISYEPGSNLTFSVVVSNQQEINQNAAIAGVATALIKLGSGPQQTI